MREREGLISILNVMLIVIILILFSPMIFNFCPFLEIGISVGSSMIPTLRTGDLLFIRDNIEDIEIGDIISFKTERGSIVHRVIDIIKDPTLMVRTKGDNNEKADKWIMAYQIEGKVIYIILIRFLLSFFGLSVLMMIAIEKKHDLYEKIDITQKPLSLNLTIILLLIIFFYFIDIYLGIYYISLK